MFGGCFMLIKREERATSEIDKLVQEVHELWMMVDDQNDWLDTYWNRLVYIVNRHDEGRVPLEKKDLSVWDLLLCDYHPFDYNFFIEAIGRDKYIWYRNPLEKKTESMSYQEIVDLWCYEVGIQWEDEPPLDS